MPILANPRDVNIQNSTLIDCQGDLIFNSKIQLSYLKPYTLLRPQAFRDFSAEYRAARWDGTCEWSTNHPLVNKWLYPDVYTNEPRLWLHGGPGTGKSILTAYLMDKKKEIRSQDEIVLCAFCGVQYGVEQTSGSIALGFLRQCLEEYSEYFEKSMFDRLYRIIWDARDGRVYTLDQLKGFLFSILKLFKKVCFMIDGVDECETEVFERRGIIEAIFNEKDIPSRFLFSSRREAVVIKRLNGFSEVEIGNKETTQGDIQIFVDREVDELASEYPECRSSKESLKGVLARGAGGMFLWVKLNIDVIRSQLPCSPATFKQVVEGIEIVPQGLTSLYEKIFSQKCSCWNETHEQIAVRTLQWLLYSRAPMTEPLLGVVVAIDADNGDLDKDNIATSIRTTINHLLGALVDWRVTDDGIPYATLVHHSLREFLISNDLPTRTPSQISSDRLFKTCCAILRSSAVRSPLKKYYDSADKRRIIIKSTIRRPIEGRDTRLQRLMCHHEDWGRWRERQLQDILEERQWRANEEKRAQSELDEFRQLAPPQFVENQENYLRSLRELRDDENEDARKVITASSLLERELMVYALTFLPCHLADILSRQGPTTPPTTCLDPIVTSLAVFIDDLKGSVSNIRAQKMDLTLSRYTVKATTFVDLPTALKYIEEAADIIHHLIRGEQYNPPARIFRGRFRPDTPTIQPSDVWTDRTALVFQETEPVALARTFELATLVIKRLRDAELALHIYEDRMAVVQGSSFLIHTLRHTGHTFALWFLGTAYRHGEPKSEIVKALQDDSYLHPGLLQRIKVTTRIALPNASPSPPGVPSRKTHPLGFFWVLFLSLILGILMSLYQLRP